MSALRSSKGLAVRVRRLSRWFASSVLCCLMTPAVAGAQTLEPFDAGISGGLPNVFAVAVQPDGKILIGGLFTALGTGCGTTPCPAGLRRWLSIR